MKARRTKRNQKPDKRKVAAAPRNKIDVQIGKAGTIEERKRVALYRQAEPLSRIQLLVAEWQLVNHLRDHPELRPKRKVQTLDGITGAVLRERDPNLERYKHATKAAADFIRDALLEWNYGAISRLAKEMKLATKHGSPEPDRKRWLLLHGVPVGKLAREIVDESFAKPAHKPDAEALERIERTREKRLASTIRDMRRMKAKWKQ